MEITKIDRAYQDGTDNESMELATKETGNCSCASEVEDAEERAFKPQTQNTSTLSCHSIPMTMKPKESLRKGKWTVSLLVF
jgi:hypothetical protein